MQQPDARQAKRVLVAQLTLIPLVTVVGLAFGSSVAVSALIGGSICLLANWVFAVLVFRQYKAQEPGMLLLRFYGAEVLKLTLVLALLATAFLSVEGLHLPALLIAYLTVQVLPAVLVSGADGCRGGGRRLDRDLHQGWNGRRN